MEKCLSLITLIQVEKQTSALPGILCHRYCLFARRRFFFPSSDLHRKASNFKDSLLALQLPAIVWHWLRLQQLECGRQLLQPLLQLLVMVVVLSVGSTVTGSTGSKRGDEGRRPSARQDGSRQSAIEAAFCKGSVEICLDLRRRCFTVTQRSSRRYV